MELTYTYVFLRTILFIGNEKLSHTNLITNQEVISCAPKNISRFIFKISSYLIIEWHVFPYIWFSVNLFFSVPFIYTQTKMFTFGWNVLIRHNVGFFFKQVSVKIIFLDNEHVFPKLSLVSLKIYDINYIEWHIVKFETKQNKKKQYLFFNLCVRITWNFDSIVWLFPVNWYLILIFSFFNIFCL